MQRVTSQNSVAVNKLNQHQVNDNKIKSWRCVAILSVGAAAGIGFYAYSSWSLLERAAHAASSFSSSSTTKSKVDLIQPAAYASKWATLKGAPHSRKQAGSLSRDSSQTKSSSFFISRRITL